MGVLETAHLLERMGQGWHVSAISYADAPLLDAWRVLEVGRLPVPRVLVGVVSGHPDFTDTTLIATTGLVRIEADEGWARTTRRFYRLGGRQQ